MQDFYVRYIHTLAAKGLTSHMQIMFKQASAQLSKVNVC